MVPVKDRYLHYDKTRYKSVGMLITGVSTVTTEFEFSLAYFDTVGKGIKCVCVVLGLQAVCHSQIMRRWSSNLGQWTIQP